VLPGITRDSIMTIARELGYEVREEMVPREMLYIADELFFAGPRRGHPDPVGGQDRGGPGRCGPVTRRLQDAFFDIINGEVPDRTAGSRTYIRRGIGR
jgi:branched-chain amino acid aminotransferase